MINKQNGFTSDEKLVQKLRSELLSGSSMAELIRLAFHHFGVVLKEGEQYSAYTIQVLSNFCVAFNIPLSVAREMWSWRYFNAGTCSDNWLQEQIMPAILRSMPSWNKVEEPSEI